MFEAAVGRDRHKGVPVGDDATVNVSDVFGVPGYPRLSRTRLYINTLFSFHPEAAFNRAFTTDPTPSVS